MKRILSVILILMLLGIAGCSNADTSSQTSKISESTQEKAPPKNEIAKMHFEKALLGLEQVSEYNTLKLLANCIVGTGRVHTQNIKQLAYIDFDGDGIEEALVNYGDNISHVLYYDFEDKQIYANLLHLKFYANGEFWWNDSDTLRYRITEFDKGQIKSNAVEYINTKPTTETPKWSYVNILGELDPQKRKALEKIIDFEYKVVTQKNKKVLKIYDNGKELQEIKYEVPESVTTKEYYLEDINFDGVKDLLLPAESSAKGIHFRTYKWNSKKNKFIDFSDYNMLTNPVLIPQRRQVIYHTSGDQMESYVITSYDTNGNSDSTYTLFWEPAYKKSDVAEENKDKIYVRETGFGETKEFFVPANPEFPLEPDFNCKEFKKYTEDGYFWDIDSDKWTKHFFELK